MDRREFVKFLGLIAAGTAALPEQVAAFTHYYHMNAPNTSNPLIAMDELFISGMADRSLPLVVDLITVRGEEEIKLALGFNAFGGVLRWVAAHDQKIVVAEGDLAWRINANEPGVEFSPRHFHGHISYVDNDGVRHTRLLAECNGRI